MQLGKRSLKKIQGFNGIRTRDLREYRMFEVDPCNRQVTQTEHINRTAFKRVKRGSYRDILVMRDEPILFSVKREFKKIFFVIRDLKVSRDP